MDKLSNNVSEPQNLVTLSDKSKVLFFKIKSRNNIKEKINIRKSESSIKLSLRNPGGEIKESETREPNKNIFSFSFKWAWQDSNLRPTDYESVALTN